LEEEVKRGKVAVLEVSRRIAHVGALEVPLVAHLVHAAAAPTTTTTTTTHL
jgi:hypothetical protein